MTIYALDGSIYERILSKPSYAQRNTKMNKIVYSQLSVTTVDGTAHHIVMEHLESKDGHKAWKDLVQWYKGDSVKNETTEELQEKMENLIFHSGITASHYINKFLQFTMI